MALLVRLGLALAVVLVGRAGLLASAGTSLLRCSTAMAAAVGLVVLLVVVPVEVAEQVES